MIYTGDYQRYPSSADEALGDGWQQFGVFRESVADQHLVKVLRDGLRAFTASFTKKGKSVRAPNELVVWIRPVYNAVCWRGHVLEAEEGSELEKRCIMHAQKYRDALLIPSDECDICIELKRIRDAENTLYLEGI